ncbi:Uncharacterized protein dnm_018020 [Desulfonema magnum]|uniref:Uncharacterized protein n=1 Tax=Desulfonema magnum TaxID=45655 RepID=A0A975BI30_9BACT|nr:Uncharacterized protein dnm_018020 [Desulfonema magnum]
MTAFRICPPTDPGHGRGSFAELVGANPRGTKNRVKNNGKKWHF